MYYLRKWLLLFVDPNMRCMTKIWKPTKKKRKKVKEKKKSESKHTHTQQKNTIKKLNIYLFFSSDHFRVDSAPTHDDVNWKHRRRQYHPLCVLYSILRTRRNQFNVIWENFQNVCIWFSRRFVVHFVHLPIFIRTVDEWHDLNCTKNICSTNSIQFKFILIHLKHVSKWI